MAQFMIKRMKSIFHNHAAHSKSAKEQSDTTTIRSNGAIGRDIPILSVLIVSILLAQLAGSALSLTPEEQALAARLVNDPGQHRNRFELTRDPILTAVARSRAIDMAKRRYFSHVNPDGNGPNYLARAAGYPLPSGWGTSRAGNYVESIGAGYRTAEEAWQGWMKSSPHRTHLLATQSFYRNQTNVGIGYCYDPASPYQRYWVILTAPPPADRAVAAARPTSHANVVQIGVEVPAWRIPGKVVSQADFRPPHSSLSAPRPTATFPFGSKIELLK